MIFFTFHARTVVAERGIDSASVLRTVSEPERTDRRPDGTCHYLRRSPEEDGRWLRVVTTPRGRDIMVITAFFDRRVAREETRK
jgi:hypothetical protein